MKLIVFTKLFKDKSIDELVELAQRHGLDGFDLCIRPGHPINPDNVSDELVNAVQRINAAGLSVPLVTGGIDLTAPDDPGAESLLAAMEQADVRLLKLGYFRFDPHRQDYWYEVAQIRKALEGWQQLAERHNVRICYHTHSHRCMGLNCAALAHLIIGLDPARVGAYIDPGHMLVEGEEFPVGASMVKQYLAAVALKDVLLRRQDNHGHGRLSVKWVTAGQGMVDWSAVFSELRRLRFHGPLSVHCEFDAPPELLDETLDMEFAFFKQLRDQAQA